MKDLHKLTDEELVRLYKSKHPTVFDVIYARYSEYIKSKAHKTHVHGCDENDLIQEGAWGLFVAVNKYDGSRDGAASFKTYAHTCIDNKILNAITAASANKNKALNTSVSYEEITESAENDHSQSPEEDIINRESGEELLAGITKDLSKLEREVFNRLIQGVTYTEIANQLGKSSKAIDNAIQRIKTKAKSIKL